MKSVSCVIPAYNEVTRIAGVIEAVLGHPLLSEIVVLVDDGSSDGTKDVVARYKKVHLVVLPQNGGKSAAVVEGIRRAQGDLIFLLDADLAGLSPGDITRLIEPVQSGSGRYINQSASQYARSMALYRTRFPFGRTRFFEGVYCADARRHLGSSWFWAPEVYMNKSIIRHRLRISVVWWGDVHSAFKHHKPGSWWLLGVNKDYLRMGLLVMRTITPWEAVYQVFAMRRLRV